LSSIACIGLVIAEIALVILFDSLFRVKVKYNGSKRAKKTILKEYPYFYYPWYKKFFFLGLNGKIPFSIILLSFVINISLVIQSILCICYIISKNIIVLGCFKLIGYVILILKCIHIFIFIKTDFKL
jgi:hypothetical protein